MGKVRQAFTAAEKLKVIKYAETHGNRAAGREFSIAESNIRVWRLKKERILKLPKAKMACRGKERQYPELENYLLEWIHGIRSQGIA
jgi:hypothetical protein